MKSLAVQFAYVYPILEREKYVGIKTFVFSQNMSLCKQIKNYRNSDIFKTKL